MKYEPLAKLIEPYLNGPLSAVPAEHRQRFNAAFFLWSLWDEAIPTKRMSMAQDYDRKNDPANEAENDYWFQLMCKVDACEREIVKWKLMQPQSVTEAALKDDKLTALNVELAALNLQYSVPFVGTAPAQNTANHAPVADSEWVTQAQARAREIVKESRDQDRYPSQEEIGYVVATEFRKAGIVGTDGKPLSGATIKRHALKGISSAKGKQLSTTIGRGK